MTNEQRFESTLRHTICDIRQLGNNWDVLDVIEVFLDQAERNGLRLWPAESGVPSMQLDQGALN